MEELQKQQGEAKIEFEVLLLTCPRDPAVFQPLIAQVREIMGRHFPVILCASKSQYRVISVLHSDPASTVAHAPSCFEETYRLLETYLQRRKVPIADRVMQWRDYRFVLHQDKAERAGSAIKLRPLEFDLAVAFFRNINRPLTREWLFRNVWGRKDCDHPVSRSLDVSVSGLRRKLGLHVRSKGPSLQAIWGQGYQLSEMPDPMEAPNRRPF
ncbi:DNA-binding response OmpR family regulator [Variovorax sp. TBS-050B]|uniref:winged helix-turn-helix domain-containing protein n=1 Tax=Variovorax sp. TBS-050B TaxID=2940551 RepID=UPI002475FAD9|nr:winged helix-turn-helix domain-containing protein [Variovorax sp. TBS-050B]MDH6594122.1 DNA-binding response OmpR family regulator [Variovorax sp. TBS-050B]